MTDNATLFTYIKDEPSFHALDRLFDLMKSRYMDKYGEQILKCLVLPRILCLYFLHLLPLENRNEMFVFFQAIQRKGARHFRSLRGRKEETKKRFRLKREILRKLDKLQLNRSRTDRTVLISDVQSEKMQSFVFQNDRQAAYRFY